MLHPPYSFRFAKIHGKNASNGHSKEMIIWATRRINPILLFSGADPHAGWFEEGKRKTSPYPIET
jgi:hypothetical protein